LWGRPRPKLGCGAKERRRRIYESEKDVCIKITNIGAERNFLLLS
jgi:hypothetical protein